MTSEQQDLKTIMDLIMNGGNAKSSAFEAIAAAKKEDFQQAEKKLKEANDFLVKAHNVQSGMLSQEAQGNHARITLLTIHSQDHIMNAITFRDLAEEIVDLYKCIYRQKNKIG